MPESVRLYAANYEALRLQFARLRENSGLSFDRLASASGVSRMALINIEHGVNHGSLETWHRVCQVFGVSLSDVIAHLDDEPRQPAAETSPAKAAAMKRAAAKQVATSNATPRGAGSAPIDPATRPARRAAGSE